MGGKGIAGGENIDVVAAAFLQPAVERCGPSADAALVDKQNPFEARPDVVLLQEAANHTRGAGAQSALNHDDFDRAVVLVAHRSQRRFRVSVLLPHGDDHTNER